MSATPDEPDKKKAEAESSNADSPFKGILDKKVTRRQAVSSGIAAAAVVAGVVVAGGAGYFLGGSVGGKTVTTTETTTAVQTGGPPKGSGTFKIGTSITTSGVTAGIVAKESDMLAAIQTAVNARGGVYIKDRGGFVPIQIISYPDSGFTDLSIIQSNYKKLITQDKVDILIGATGSPQSPTAAAVAIDNSIPYIDGVAAETSIFTLPGAGKWVVGSINVVNYWLWNYLDLLKTQTTAKTVAVVDNGDDYTTQITGTGKPAFGGLDFLKTLGFNVLTTDHVNTSFSPNFDYTAEVQKMKSLDPDVIIYADQVGVFTAQFWQTCKAQGYKPRAFHPIQGTTVAFTGTAGPLIQGTSAEVYWDPSRPFAGQWGRGFWDSVQTAAAFKDTDFPWLSIYYACVEIATAGATLAGTADKSAVADVLNSSSIATLLGEFRAQSPVKTPTAPPSGIDLGHGEGVVIPTPAQWQNGKRVIVWPPEVATGTYQYPEPFAF